MSVVLLEALWWQEEAQHALAAVRSVCRLPVEHVGGQLARTAPALCSKRAFEATILQRAQTLHFLFFILAREHHKHLCMVFV